MKDRKKGCFYETACTMRTLKLRAILSRFACVLISCFHCKCASC